MSTKLLRGQVRLEPFAWQSTQAGVHVQRNQDAADLPAERSDTVPQSLKNELLEQQLAGLQAELARLRAEAETKQRDSYQSGVAAGREAANAELQREQESLGKRLGEALAESARARQNLLRDTDRDLVRLALAIAEKVLNRQLQMDVDALAGIARSALERVAGKDVQMVRMHPEDEAVIRRELASIAGSGMQLRPDSRLPRGSLIFETNLGSLDCSINTQLEEIERGLSDRLHRSHS